MVHVCDVQPELQWFDDYVGLHDRDSDKSGRMNDPVSDYATHIKAAVKSEMAKRRLQSDSYNHLSLCQLLSLTLIVSQSCILQAAVTLLRIQTETKQVTQHRSNVYASAAEKCVWSRCNLNL